MKRILKYLPLILFVAGPAFAEEQQCFKDEYVITASPAPALVDKAIEALEGVKGEPLRVGERGLRAVLLEDKDSPKDANGASGDVEKYDRRKDLCERLQAKQRAEKLQAVENDAHAIVRRVSCSCNAVIKIDATPNDSYMSSLWGMNSTNSANADVDGPEAWNISTGDSSTIVAVIDTGVDYTHPDLAANMWHNPGEIPNNGIDDDGNGYVDDYYGWNAVANNGDPKDDHYHGTHCAGTIAGVGNNGQGVVGVGWRTKIMAVKFLSSTGSGSLYDAVESIDYVTTMRNRGTKVVLSSNSWGGGGYYSPLYDAITRHEASGLLFVAAAGNNGQNTDASPSYPAGYPNAGIVSVAAIDESGALASFSNYGATTVDVGAPGVNILSTSPNGGYQYLSGTSMATPHVSGALALLAGYNPTLSAATMKSILLNSGKPNSNLVGKTLSGKMISAYQMLLSTSAGPTPVPTSPPTSTPTPTITPTATTTPTPLPTTTPTTTPTVTPTPVPGWWDITGVVSLNGQGVAGATVTWSTSTGRSVTAVTGLNGDYRMLQVLGPINYTMHVAKPGMTFSDQAGYLNSNRVINFAGASQSYLLTVMVMDVNRNLLPGVSITTEYGSDTTDLNGTVHFNVPFGSTYSFTPILDGYRFNRSNLSGVMLGDVTRLVIAESLN